MHIEVLNTGTELLLGSVLNTHLSYFAKSLFPLGLRIVRQTTVPDGEAIRDGLLEALPRAEVILVTGGLGPTTDDLTRDIVAELLGWPLEHNEAVMASITHRFTSRGFTLTERVSRQAQVPRGAVVLENRHGTAPGLYLEVGSSELTGGRAVHLFLLPGPPRELQPMFDLQVVPILKELAGSAVVAQCRTFHVLGMGESNVEALVGERLLAIPGLELGYCARPGEVDIRCIGHESALASAEGVILEALGDQIVSRDGRSLEQMVVDALTARHEKVVTAESCTGGFIANLLTNVPGASAVYLGGFVTYSNQRKEGDLGVPSSLIQTHGAVSEPVARAMAEGALNRAGADWALATTGIAGPEGGSPEKPVGTVFIALARKQGVTVVEKHRFVRERVSFKQITVQTALDLLRRNLGS